MSPSAEHAVSDEAWERRGLLQLPALVPLDVVERLRCGALAAGVEGTTRKILERVPEVAEVAGSLALREVVEAILGQGARLVRALWLDKTAAWNWPVAWHQDRVIAVRERCDVPGYGPWSIKGGVAHVEPPLAVLRAMASLRIALDDCGPEDGPLRVVPGTHRSVLGPEELAAAARRGPCLELCARAGDAVLVHPLLVHASGRARSPGHRRVLHLEHAAASLSPPLRWRYQLAAAGVRARDSAR